MGSGLYDTRDNGINPQRGWLASSADRTFYKGFLGGDSSWQELYLDLRTYRKITADGRHRLAFWAMSDSVTNGTAPYFDLPTTGGDGARHAGTARHVTAAITSCTARSNTRGTLTSNGLLGMSRLRQHDDHRQRGGRSKASSRPGRRRGGAGLRLLLNKRSRTNLATDYAWGKGGARGFYLGIQEAF